jgi:ABC-type phosphate transport system permease subunit
MLLARLRQKSHFMLTSCALFVKLVSVFIAVYLARYFAKRQQTLDVFSF